MTDAQRHVAAAMLTDPAAALPFAYATLEESDFADASHRWLFRNLVGAWHLSNGDFSPGPHYRGLIAVGYEEAFRMPEGHGIAFVQDLEEWNIGVGSAYQAFCLGMAAESALRRSRSILRAYLDTPGDRNPAAGQQRLFFLFHDILQATKRYAELAALCPEQPGWVWDRLQTVLDSVRGKEAARTTGSEGPGIVW